VLVVVEVAALRRTPAEAGHRLADVKGWGCGCC